MTTAIEEKQREIEAQRRALLRAVESGKLPIGYNDAATIVYNLERAGFKIAPRDSK